MRHDSSKPGRTGLAAICAAAIMLGSAGMPVFAVSGGGGGGTTPIVCSTGWVYDKEKGACVRVQTMDDWELYREGRLLADAGHYGEALGALEAIRDKHDAMVLTMIGYSKRKLGAIDEGMAYYHQALAIDPNSANTREYLGEGYVTIGRFDLAEAELAKIEKICGTGCDQYVDLAQAIAGEWQ